MNDMKRLLSYAGPYKRDMIFGAVLVLVETCFELFIPILISNLIDIGIANGDLSYIYRKGIQMGICALFALVTGILYALRRAQRTAGEPRSGRRSMRKCSGMHSQTSTTLRCRL